MFGAPIFPSMWEETTIAKCEIVFINCNLHTNAVFCFVLLKHLGFCFNSGYQYLRVAHYNFMPDLH